MKISKISADKVRSVFLVEDTSVSYLNVLRRIMQYELPILAIEHVEIRKNSGVLYDEILAHRLGLIPLTTDVASYRMLESGEEADSPATTVVLTLQAEAGDEARMVLAKELKSSDSKVQPVYPEMPIVKLHPGQSIEIEAKAVMGLGKEHAKWCTGLIFYREVPTIKITKDSSEVKKVFPASLYEYKGKTIALKDLSKAISEPGLLDVEADYLEPSASGKFLFVIESWGQLSPTAIVEHGIETFNNQLKALGGIVKAQVKS